jgi:hypothetical protein
MERRRARGARRPRLLRANCTRTAAISLAVLTGALLGACASGHGTGTSHRTTGRSTGVGRNQTPASTSPGATASVAPGGATTTAPDPGVLPQTSVLPSADDPVFEAHVADLWRAVVDGNPTEAMPFFFPLAAYVQVKAIADPVHDWQTRLVADFADDVLADHAALGTAAGAAEFSSASVGPSPVWVQPGTEYNKGSYWRVYGTTLRYVEADRPGAFVIASMISWRGEWYVVHLASIR